MDQPHPDQHLRRHPPQVPPGPHRAVAPSVALQIVRGLARNRCRPVVGPVFVMGTALDGDLVLGDPQFPEAHCYLMRGADGVRIKHLGVPPSLSVNGQITAGTALADGDRIRLGPYEFVVRITAGDAPPGLLVPRPAGPASKSAADNADTDVDGESHGRATAPNRNTPARR